MHDWYEAGALVSRYFAAVDDKRLDADVVAQTFTPEGRIVRPDGVVLFGRDAILSAQSESFARFRATQHMITDLLADRDGDAVRLRANVHAMHLWAEGRHDPRELESYFSAGGVLRAVAVQTTDGWRLDELSHRPTWRSGAAIAMMSGRRTAAPASAGGATG
jgi:hypothetical protein